MEILQATFLVLVTILSAAVLRAVWVQHKDRIKRDAARLMRRRQR
jgi:hypothetical protein